MSYIYKYNPLSDNFDIVQDTALLHFKDPVASYSDLPITGNGENDARFVKDTDKLWVWSIASASGLLTDWKETAKMSIADLDDVADSSTYGKVKQTELVSGQVKRLDDGTNEVEALDAKDAVTKKHTHSNQAQLDLVSDGDHDVIVSGNPHSVSKSDVSLGNVDNKSEATIISDVKADSDISDAITKKHLQNTDTDLDATFEATFVKKTDTANVLSDITSAGADIEDAVTKKHSQNTDTILKKLEEILNEDCSDISDWIDNDYLGESTQVTFDSKSCFKFDTGVVGGNACRWKDNVGIPNNYTFEINLYCEAIGGNNDRIDIMVRNSVVQLAMDFRSDGLFVYGNEVGTNLVQLGIWQNWRFEVTTNGIVAGSTVNVYLDDVLVGENISIAQADASNQVWLRVRGYSTNNRIAYVDYVTINSTADLFNNGELKSDLTVVAGKKIGTNTIEDITDAVTKKHSATILGTKEIDETDIGDGKMPTYDSVSGKLKYVAGATADRIFEGDSKVEVVDTGIGYVTIVTEGVERVFIDADGLDIKSGDLLFGGNIFLRTTGTGQAQSIFIGENAGNISTANSNVLIGRNAGYYVGSGQANIIIGVNAGKTGYNNVIVGFEAGVSMASEQNVIIGTVAGLLTNTIGNVLLGYGAGYAGAGGKNICIGWKAGWNETGSNKLYIANSDTTTPLIYGEFDNDLFRINGNLDIVNGYLLFGGNKILHNPGTENTFLGLTCGVNLTIGTSNVFVGMYAGWNNTSGSHNVFIGRGAGYMNEAGGYNIHIGRNAGLRGGFSNVCIGDSSGENYAGEQNVYMGALTGYLCPGSNNVFIGNRAGYNEAGSNKLYISNTDTATPLIYGEFDNDLLRINGRLGIGLSPTANMVGLSVEAGLLTIKETTTPTADVDYGKVYTKIDNKLYFQDGAGVEHTIAYV